MTNLKNTFPIILLLFVSLKAIPCATDTKSLTSSKDHWKAYWKTHSAVKNKSGRKPSDLDSLPFAKQNPWGGIQTSRWKPEAVLANSVSEALNDGWSQENVKDVLVAVPLKMLYSNARPYGDGQTNSSINFGVELGKKWNEREPPLVATLILLKSGEMKMKFRFHRKLSQSSKTAKIIYYRDSKKFEINLTRLTRTSAGDFEVEWTPNSAEAPVWGTLFKNNIAYIQLDNQKDWFPIDFRDVVKPNQEMLSQVPASKRTLGKGNLLDPENVSVQQAGTASFPFLNMEDQNFGSDINADRYFPVAGSGIHNEFPLSNGKTAITAVGHGNTLVMVKAPAPFKLAYICFDARNEVEEAKYGVPSGGGWHEIGDPAETVINSLENSPVVFGYANGSPEANPPSGKFAYGLTDVAVIRKIMPGSAIITAAGPTTRAEDLHDFQNPSAPKIRGTGIPEGRNYHWFIFDQPHEICATEWVHPCVPSESNHLGMQCN